MRGCVDSAKVDLKEMGVERVDWICLTQDRVQWRANIETGMKVRTV
jgi:hypothetical protein